jgi:hypothetical protein
LGGGNLSLDHIDFMIGSSEMQIDGLKKEGNKVAIFRDGEWSLEGKVGKTAVQRLAGADQGCAAKKHPLLHPWLLSSKLLGRQ